jgi:hypothetical protein
LRRLARLVTAAAVALTLLPALPAQAVTKEQRFSIKCPRSHTAQVDPIVNPYGIAAHVHEFFGNEGTSDDPRIRFMRDNGTTCDLDADTAAYWAPMFHEDGVQVPQVHSLAYYRNNGSTSDVSPRPFPANFRLITDEYEWMCLDTQTFPEAPDCDGSAGHTVPAVGVGIRYKFPRCWVGKAEAWTPGAIEALGFRFNGKGQVIDSADHRSHVIPSTARGCDNPAYPVLLPNLAMNIRFGKGVNDATGFELAPGATAPHADFWNTWHQPTLRTLVTRCLDRTTGPWSSYSGAEWEARCNQVTNADFALGD